MKTRKGCRSRASGRQAGEEGKGSAAEQIVRDGIAEVGSAEVGGVETAVWR